MPEVDGGRYVMTGKIIVWVVLLCVAIVVVLGVWAISTANTVVPR